MAGQSLSQGAMSKMGSPAKQAQYLNFSSEFATDEVIYTKSDVQPWVAAQSYVYTTPLGDYCLPVASFSLDGQTWYNEGAFDESGVYSFGYARVSDNGVITIAQSAPFAPQTLYIRIMCLAHPNQKPFTQAQTGSTLSYKFDFNYLKIAQFGVINVPISLGTEASVIIDIPHDLGYAPNYKVFARLLNANDFVTQNLPPSSRPKIAVDNNKLHFDNYQLTPLLNLTAYQYFYILYYD